MFGAALCAMSFFAACSDDEDSNPVPPESEEVTEVEGVWEAGSTHEISSHLVVPEGKSLTIEEGVTVIFSTSGVGVNHAPIEFTVDGSLYCLGTEANPILLSIPESERTDANILKGMWGGIVASASCPEMVIDHTIVEYTGGQVIEGSPAATNKVYTAGDDAYPQITTNNVKGKYVVTNSILRNGWSDGIYMMGGQAIIANNIFAANGDTGGEAVNIKAGCTVDVANNVMFSPNTNGLKLSSSGQDDGAGRYQARIQAYNNTIVNAGWRRDGEKGGCIYVEKNALANVFNNLMYNCKFRAMTPNFDKSDDPEEGYAKASVIDYNMYSSSAVATDLFQETYEEDGEEETLSGVHYAWEGYTWAECEDYNQGVVDEHSKIADAADNLLDPMFANYSDAATSVVKYDDAWDFSLKAGSPALDGAYSGSETFATPLFGTTALIVNETEYKSPAPQAHFGAYGAK